jgi:hypothetical protein
MLHPIQPRPTPTHRGLNVALVELPRCRAERNRSPIQAWLPQCPLNVQAIGLGPLYRSLLPRRYTECNDPSALRF